MARKPRIHVPGGVYHVMLRGNGMKEAELKGPGQRRDKSEVRAVVGWLAMEYGSATLSEVGKRFNRDVGTMSSAVRRLVDRAMDEQLLRERMEGLKSDIT